MGVSNSPTRITQPTMVPRLISSPVSRLRITLCRYSGRESQYFATIVSHVGGSRRQIDPCRRAKAEHRLQPLQHSHQSRQRRRIKAGANFDSAARADNDRQSYYRLLPSCRIHGWQLHCNQTAASTCAPSFLSFPQITIQSIQHYSVPAAKLARPQAALNKLFHHLLDRQCTATRTPHRNLLFAHANTSPQQPAIKQVRCSHAYVGSALSSRRHPERRRPCRRSRKTCCLLRFVITTPPWRARDLLFRRAGAPSCRPLFATGRDLAPS